MAYNGIKVCIEDMLVEKYGVVTGAVVLYHKNLYDRDGKETVSVGFYKVNYRRLRIYYHKVIPIDSTFKVKYYPKKPKIARIYEEE